MTVKRQLAEYASRLGLGAALRGIQRARGRGGAFIVEYHRVSDAPSCFGLTVSPQLFEEQIALFGRLARIVPLQALVERLRRPERLQEDLVAITFDDGYLDNLEVAEPILRRHRAPATVFVTVDFAEGHTTPYWDHLERILAGFRLRKARPDQWRGVGNPTLDGAIRNAIGASEDGAVIDSLDRALRALSRQDREEVLSELIAFADVSAIGERLMLSWSEVRALADRGIEIGCHTVSHPALSLLCGDELARELVASKRMIEERIGRPVRGFAFPFGDYSKEALETARSSGFDYACTTIEGANFPGEDLFELRRIDCGGQTPELLDLKLAVRGVWSPRAAPAGLAATATVGG